MKPYRPQELADLLNLSPATIRKWASEDYGEYLSPTGQGGQGARRSFTEHDARIIAWIAVMKRENIQAKDILATLKTCQDANWKSLPPIPQATMEGSPIAVMPREAVEEKLIALKEHYELQLVAIQKERNQLQDELVTKQRELDLKSSELETARREAAEALRTQQKETTDLITTLQQRITELSTKEAELRGRMEQYSFGGRRVSAVILILGALVLGAVVTITIVMFVYFLIRPH
jgi:DNA-binding transcriptional MerR regulator